jgi:flagellar motor switch protein FliM
MAETGLATRASEMALMAGIKKTGVVPDVPWMARIEEHAGWLVLSRLPMTLAARIPLTQFAIRDLLQLKAGQVLQTDWSEMEDVPLSVGQVKLGWCEFEVLEKRIGVRLTRLA